MTIYNDYRGLLDNSQNETQRWNGMTERGTPIVLTYSFRNSSNLNELDRGLLFEASADRFEELSNTEKSGVRTALDTISGQAGMIFVEVEDEGMLDFSGMVRPLDVAGFGYYPYTTGTSRNDNTSIILDSSEPNGSYGRGGFMHEVIVHEVGHTLGLEHSFEQGPGTNGVSAAIDNTNHTLMSYTEIGIKSEFQRLDIDALDFLYGARVGDNLGWDVDWNEQTNRLTITGSARNDTIIGANRATVIDGGAGNDKLYGRESDDLFLTSAGADRFDGGDGIDGVSYANATSGVIADLRNRERATSGEAQGDRFFSIENLTGSAFDDVLSGGVDRGLISGGAGDDILTSVTAGTRLSGGDGDDTFLGSTSDGRTDGGDGFDTADYSRLTSGVQAGVNGNAHISVERVIGTGFFDVIRGDAGDNILEGMGATDILTGACGNDTLMGGDGNDILQGGDEGDDLLDGGAGIDIAQYTSLATGVTVDLLDPSTNAGLAVGDTYLSIETVYGSKHDDVLRGDDEDNLLRGDRGDDILYGRSGDDRIEGKFGDDVLYGGDGDDSIAGSVGDDVLIGGAGADRLFGNAGTDQAQYSDSDIGLTVDLRSIAVNTGNAAGDTFSSIEGLSGSAFDDSLRGNNVNNVLNGQDGDDRLIGRDGNDQLFGEAGDDVLVGGSGRDALSGGAGFDTADYGGNGAAIRIDLERSQTNTGQAIGDTFVSIEAISATDFADRLYGDAAASTLIGKGGTDALFGRAGDDTLIGGDGDDTLSGGTGADVLDGGDGFDRAYYGQATARVRIDLDNTARNSGEAAGDSYASVEAIWATEFDDLLFGGSGDDILYGRGGGDVIYGLDGDDTLIGGNGDDVFFGGAGADFIKGEAGVDRVNYGDSDSGLVVDLQNAAASTGIAAGDVLNSIEDIQGSRFADTVRGDGAANVLSGLGGSDILIGRGGDDTLNGQAGNDMIYGGVGADVMDGGTGIDRALYGDADEAVTVDMERAFLNRGIADGDTLVSIEDVSGSAFDDMLRGDDGDNQLWGFNGSDLLHGRSGDDILNGGSGSDRLIGDDGDDTLTGGAGADVFAFRSQNGGVDTIVDFVSGLDQIQIDDAGFNALSRGRLDADQFVNGAAALDADDFLLYDGSALFYDSDGNGAADAIQIAELNGATLLADDILIL